MGNITTTIDEQNSDILTIDISRITSEQRRLLKKCINYDVDYAPDNIPLITALLLDSMTTRKVQIANIINAEAITASAEIKLAVLSDL